MWPEIRVEPKYVVKSEILLQSLCCERLIVYFPFYIKYERNV